MIRAGVLSLQGDFAEHLASLAACDVPGTEVRSPADLETVDALVIPGGESTTMLKLIDRFELREPLVKRIQAGMPVFGTCAGAIVLAHRTSDGETPLGMLDLFVRRNAYGRQRDSFEAELEVTGVGAVYGVFIRAPVFEEPGAGVAVLATWDQRPVAVRAGRILATAFHPELTRSVAMHRYFLDEIAAEIDSTGDN
ncbi:MAG: pyridoxal 5'-phosphate synthase glutaminase subunit PdxT [Actinomycetota bacterium]